MQWGFLDGDGIRVPGNLTKNRQPHTIALTPELEEILDRRKAATVAGCPFIFHRDGQRIKDYEKIWDSTCVAVGLGQYFCKDCKDSDGKYISAVDAHRRCPRCGKHWELPKYIGKIFHDFRRSAAHEMWKSGSSKEDCMEVTGHKTRSMFDRYADLFSEDEKRRRQREVQQRRSEWKKSQAHVVEMPNRVVVQ